MMKKLAFCILILLVFIGGCTTNLSEKNRTVKVTSVPLGADVYLDNETLGTPLSTTAVPTPTTETTSANVQVVSLDVIPIVAEPRQSVTVNVKVTNVGETIGTNKVALTVNGAEEEVKDVTVKPKSNRTITFTLKRDISGIYDIKVGGLTETIRVKQAGAYPRLGNDYTGSTSFFRNPSPIQPEQLKSLARWDIIAVPYEVYKTRPAAIQQIKRLNPQIKILVWIELGLRDYWELKNIQSANENWFLHYGSSTGDSTPPEQRRVTMINFIINGEEWKGMNPASGWSTFLPNYVHDKPMSTGFFDGVYYDCTWEDVSRWHNIDINNDGIAESPDVVNREYQKGTTQLLKLTRELLGPEAIIIGNPGAEWSANSPYWNYANGLYQENALGDEKWSSHEFSKVWEIYETNMQKPAPPSRINWIGVDTNNKQFDDVNPDLSAPELQKMRYGLAITLLDDGYFGFDRGDKWHCQLWWFPEYDANLGLANGDAKKRNDGTWMREFQNGMVIVNPTGGMSTIDFNYTYQDVTTGTVGSHFVVSPYDGRIFVAAH